MKLFQIPLAPEAPYIKINNSDLEKSTQKVVATPTYLPGTAGPFMIDITPSDDEAAGEASTVLKLMQKIHQADFLGAEKIITENPEIMFTTVFIRQENDTFEKTNPIRYAAKLLYTDMWRMFYERIKTQENLVKQFQAELRNQQEAFSLVPLMKAYEDFLHTYESSLNNPKTNLRPRLNIAWECVGNAQQKLPRHFLSTICNANPTSWKMCGLTQATNAHDAKLQVYDYNKGKDGFYFNANQTAFSALNNALLENDPSHRCTLIRGDDTQGAALFGPFEALLWTGAPLSRIESDAETFRLLYLSHSDNLCNVKNLELPPVIRPR